MAVRTRRIAGPTNIPFGVSTVLYTVPPDRTLLVKYVSLFKDGAGTGAAYFGINGTGSGTIILRLVGPTGESNDKFVNWVLTEGETLEVAPGQNAVHTITVHGVLLFGDPA